MKKCIFALALLIGAVMLQSCATQQYYAMAVNSWQGANQEDVYRVWGYPDKVRKLPNGHKVLLYRDEVKGRDPVYSTPGSTTIVQHKGHTKVVTTAATVSGGGTYDYKCVTGFEINNKGQVVNASFRGNNCLATKEYMQTHFYRGF